MHGFKNYHSERSDRDFLKSEKKQTTDPDGISNAISKHCSQKIERYPSRDCLNFLHAAWKHAG